MTPRERMLTALDRRAPDRLPKNISFTDPAMEVVKEKIGTTNYADYFGLEARLINFAPTKLPYDFGDYLPDLPEGAVVTEWGIGELRRPDTHYYRYASPMRNLQTIAEIRAYPYPDITAGYRHEGLERQVAELHARGLAVGGAVTPGDGAFFECAWLLRGLDLLLEDMLLRPELAETLLDIVAEQSAFMAGRYAQAGVDFIFTGDDVGTERGMLISPSMWRRMLKPRLAGVIAAARQVKPGIHVFYHSDGDCRPIIPELIEIGVTALNPVQPECMDPAALKREYGDRLAFWGTVGTQTTMPFGSPEDVRRVVLERFETVGKGGGLVIAPTQIIEPDVPWENVLAFFEAVEECRY